MSLLLASQAPVLDPANFPFPQPVVPVVRVVRATALMLAAAVMHPAPIGLGAVRFDSATDGLKSSPRGVVPANNTAYTAMGWFKYDSAAPDDSFIVGSDASGTGLFLETKTGVLSLVDTHGFSRPTNVPGTLVNGQWYFAAIRVNGTTAHIFRGDEKTATVSSAPGTIAAQGNLQQWWFSFSSSSFVGSMSDWLVYDAVLSDAEIEAQRLTWTGPGSPTYQTTPLRSSNLTAFYRLQSSSNKLADSSGNAASTLIQDSTGPWEESVGPDLSFRTEWMQRPADLVRAARRPPADQLAFVQLVTAAPAVALDWLPTFPDFARGMRRATPFDPPAVFALDQFDVPLLSWAPAYPERVRARATPATGSPSYTFALDQFAVPLMSWAPVFPERVRGRPTPTRFEPPAVFALDQFPSPPIDGWAPTFAERVRARARAPDGGPTFVQLVASSTVALDWLPTFPDRVRGRQTPVRFDPPAVFALDQFAVPPLTWAPTFADRVARRGRAVDGGPTLVQLVSAAAAVALDWLPTFPERARATSRPVATFAPSVFAIDTFAVPALAWAPTYPERVRAALRASNPGGLAAPRVVDFAPLMAWQGVFPERVLARRRALDVGAVTAVWVDVVPSSSWAPTYPERVRARARPLDVGGAALVQLVAPVVVTPMSWAPEYPVMVWRKVTTRLGAMAWVWVFEGTLPFTTGGASGASTDGAPTEASASGTPSAASGPDDSTNAASSGTPTKANKT